MLCICCNGGGWRGEEAATPIVDVLSVGNGICFIIILVTVGGFEGVAMEAGWGLMAPVRERVVTCGRSMMMLDVQMLVMVFSSGL